MQDDIERLTEAGNTRMLEGQPAAAEAAYRAALALDAGHLAARNNLGNALRAQGLHAAAIAQYEQVLAARPGFYGVQNNIASALLALHRPVEAEALLRAALAQRPDYAEAANNLGGALLAQDRLGEAVTWFSRALALDPGLMHAKFGRGVALLAQGEFANGWADYEARWDDPRFAAETNFPNLPRWPGGDPAGRRILLQAEQGLGDTIQFARYAAALTAKGADIVLEVPPSLVTLLSPLAASVVPTGAASPGCDSFCPLLSLPLACATTLDSIPADIPYLQADALLAAGWSRRLGPPHGRRIGLALSGSAEHEEDALRSIPAATWAPLLALPGCEFHLLQTDCRASDRGGLQGVQMHDRDLPDFAATAALALQMDLVISVDTAIAHLAGALGLPVWLLLPVAADFRWLRGRDTSPWYPTARLFRQSEPGNWRDVIARVAAELAG